MIYFIQGEGSKAVKIGYTGNDPEKRLAALQTGSPEKLTLLGSVDGGIEVERQLHDRFEQFRLHGEWFRPDPSLLVAIDGIIRPPLLELLAKCGARAYVIEGTQSGDDFSDWVSLFCIWSCSEPSPMPAVALQAVWSGHKWRHIERIVDVSRFPASWGVDEESLRRTLSRQDGNVRGVIWNIDSEAFGPFTVYGEALAVAEVARKAEAPTVFRVGQRVVHDSYGIGQIVAINGKSPDYKGRIVFAVGDERVFVLARAPLKPLDTDASDYSGDWGPEWLNDRSPDPKAGDHPAGEGRRG